MINIVASFIEAAGPIRIVGAQFLYIGQPLLDQVFPKDHLDALANILEDPLEATSFTHFLQQEDH